ncbi:peptidoglycan/xylan/chitin deacetylase (PgdA/CDA1 family) [Rhizobium skierniewicense]|uniref:Chitooligosaccharide deacetylase n=1 Tax=Rhizobium skierniewicense TaxID=984260 RepID=A0A7W6G1D0_9HYPH|nr:polysaccharide deacetylase family protein [Rhizobium skierniewicense]MBB3944391.1 peptidoglycan/xylan/chitin deacetylase (PgdA/CDA1 family) [Rhizobium skierniewicense]
MPLLSKARYVGERIAERAVRALPVSTLNVTCQRPIVSFTFDDVPDTAYTEGARILEENGVRGTFYIAGSLIGTAEPDRNLISAEECRSLAQSGHEIGCHTFAHKPVSTLSGSELARDLNGNAEVLDGFDHAGGLRNFAYPYNQGSLRHRHAFSKRYATARAGGDRINRGKVNRSYLWGMEIRQPDVAARALTRQIDAVVAEPGWLIFFTHDISNDPTPYGCTPETFSSLVRHAVSTGCLVLPVRDALGHIGEVGPG